MITEIKQTGRLQRSIWAVPFLAICFLLYQPDKALAQWTFNGVHIYNTNSGNVGLGVTSPYSRLTLPAGQYISFDYFANAASRRWWFTTDTVAFGDFAISTETTQGRTSPNLPRFYIDPAGNVGIGTATPGEKLTLAGNISFTDRGTDGTGDVHMSNNNSGVRIFAANTLGQVPDGAAFQFFGNAAPNFPGMGFIDSGAHNSAAIIFRTAQAGQGVTERMRITAAGNIAVTVTTAREMDSTVVAFRYMRHFLGPTPEPRRSVRTTSR